MRLALLLLTSLVATAQTPPAPVTVTVKTGTSQKIWQFFFGPAIQITAFTCDRSATADDPLLPGESSTCTVTVAPVPKKPVQITVVVPEPLTGGPTGGILTIPAGQAVETFTVLYPVGPGVPIAFVPVAAVVWTDDKPTIRTTFAALARNGP